MTWKFSRYVEVHHRKYSRANTLPQRSIYVYSIFRPFFHLWLEHNQISANPFDVTEKRYSPVTFGWRKPSNRRPLTSLADKEMLTFLTKLLLSGALGRLESWKVVKLFKTYQAFFFPRMLIQTLGRNIFRPELVSVNSNPSFQFRRDWNTEN